MKLNFTYTSKSIALLLAGSMLSGCLTTRPSAKVIREADANMNSYHEIIKPNRKKRVNTLGTIINIGMVGGGAAAGYFLNDGPNSALNDPLNLGNSIKNPQVVPIVYAAGGAIVGHLISRGIFLLAGNHKYVEVKPDGYEQWVRDYNKTGKYNWKYMTAEGSATDTSFLVLSRNRESLFIPKNYRDAENYITAFPESKFINEDFLKRANDNMSKAELDKTIGLYTNYSNTINSTKAKYILLSANESEIIEGLKRFPDQNANLEIEKRYASLVSSLQSAKDFSKRYPNSVNVGLFFNKTLINSLSNDELVELIDSYPQVTPNAGKTAKKMLFDRSTSYSELKNYMNKYSNIKYAVNEENSLDDIQEAGITYINLNSYLENTNEEYKQKPEPNNNIDKILVSIPKEYMQKRLAQAKDEEALNRLLEEYNANTWMQNDSTALMIDKVISRKAVQQKKPIFISYKKTDNGLDSGVCYASNGTVIKGILKKSAKKGSEYILEGYGTKITEINRETGVFKNDELNGQGERYNLTTGVVLKGQFLQGALNGQGSRTNTATGVSEEGIWEKGKLINGSKTFANGDTYSGEFKNTFMNGKGTYTWKENNMRYVGIFVNDKRDGNGTLYVNNWEISGTWDKATDCPIGKLKLEEKIGKERKTSWQVKNCKIYVKEEDTGFPFSDEDILRTCNPE